MLVILLLLLLLLLLALSSSIILIASSALLILYSTCCRQFHTWMPHSSTSKNFSSSLIRSCLHASSSWTACCPWEVAWRRSCWKKSKNSGSGKLSGVKQGEMGWLVCECSVWGGGEALEVWLAFVGFILDGLSVGSKEMEVGRSVLRMWWWWCSSAWSGAPFYKEIALRAEPLEPLKVSILYQVTSHRWLVYDMQSKWSFRTRGMIPELP